MGYEIDNQCVGCPQGCVHCGRDVDRKIYFCDECEDRADESNPLYIYEGKELCWECYKEQFTQKVCDDLDDTLCAECGHEAETLYLYEGDWVCEECLKNLAEKVEMD